MTTCAKHPSRWRGLRRRLVLTAIVAVPTFGVVTSPVLGSTETTGSIAGPDLNVSVANVISIPRHDEGLANHTVTFTITNPDLRLATVDGTSTGFGDDVLTAGISIVTPDPLKTVACEGVYGDVFSPDPNAEPVTSISINCDPFELPGQTSATVVVSVISLAKTGDAPLNIELRIYADDDANTGDNTAAAIVEFDGDPNSTFDPTAFTTTTTASQPTTTLARDLVATTDPLPDGSLPETGKASNVQGTSTAAVLLVTAGACLSAIARRRHRPLR